MQVMQQSLLYSILEHSHVIQVHKCCTKWETFRFAVPAWNLFTQDNKTKAWSHLSGGHVFGKVRVLTKSRNRCKLSLFRFHYSAWFFLCFSKHVTSLVIRKLSQRFTFTPNSKREFVPRDQVSPYFPLFSVYSLLLLHKNKSVLCQL